MDVNRRSPFGMTLRQFREAAGLSQEELAERAGLSLRGISDLERGLRTTPRLETVRMIADGLGLNEEQRIDILNARNSSAGSRPSLIPTKIHKLPVPTTSFIGRVEEIESIIGMLATDRARLITLTGPGGVGKTRIAIEAAHQLIDRFPDGVVFVDLSATREPAMVIPAIADRLGIPARGDLEIRDVLDIALQGRNMLLVLDNLEQVIGAATEIAWLLAACPDLSIIATSRIILRISAEHVMPIEPLPLPTYHDVYSFNHVDAVALFVARARAADQRLLLDHENAPVVAAIVNRLQGMPLAIELAAARLRLLPLQELLKRLDSQLPVLAGDTRDVPERHRTMRNTIAWSYDLLSPRQQHIFRALAIFPDGCTLATAAAVLTAEGSKTGEDPADAVETLLDSSLLRRWLGPDGQARYRMLQPVREFGMEALADSGEEFSARRSAHEAWCVPLVRESEFVQARADSIVVLNQIEAEQQNLREHLAWLIASDLIEEALDVSGSLAPSRALRAQYDEARRELELLLAHPRGQEPTLARVRAQIVLAMIYMNQAEFTAALEVLEEGIAFADQLNERWYQAQGLIIRGAVLWNMGQLDESEVLSHEGLAIAEDLDSTYLRALGTGGLGLVAAQRGDMARSYETWEQALALSESIGSSWGEALSKINLAYTYSRDGDLDRGEQLLLEAQELLIQMGDRRDLPGVDLNLAWVAMLRGDLSRARSMFEHMLATARETGSMKDIAESTSGLAQVALREGDLTSAESLACSAIFWFERCGSVIDAVLCLADLADIAIAAGDGHRAAWCIGAFDGVLADRGISHAATEAAEQEARTQKARTLLDEGKWQLQYEQGRASSVDDILTEVHSWQTHPVRRVGAD